MRWIVRVLGVVVVLAVAAVAALFLVPTERIAALAADQFRAATGRAMTVEGPVRPTLWPDLGVSTGRVTVANADWSQAGPMLTAEALSIRVEPLALLRGEWRIGGIEAQAPEVTLERAADGRVNWDFGGETGLETAETAPAGAAGLPPLSLDRAALTGARLAFIDHAAGTRTEFSDIDATLRLPDLAGPAEVELSGRLHGQALSLAARIERFGALLDGGTVPVALTLTTGESRLSFDGRAAMSPAAAGGRVEADLADLPALFALLDQPAPDLPPGVARALRAEGEVTASDAGRITVRDATVVLGDSRLALAADIDTAGDRPTLKVQVAAGHLDLSPFTGGGAGDTGGDAGAAAAEGWSRTPIDVSALQALDAEIAFTADSVDLGVAELGRTRTLTSLQAGRAVTEIRELIAFGGALTGSLVVNSRGGLSVRVSLTGAGVALQPLLLQLADYDRLLASGDVTVNLLAVGDDMHSLMNSLSGQGAINLGQGELRGFDLAGMIRNLNPSYVGEGQRTIFDSVTATFEVEKGQLTNQNLAFLSPMLNASGKGRVGIGGQDMDYRLLPVLLEGSDGTGIRVPVTVRGPWAAPRFSLDLEELARQQFGREIDALKTQAEAAVTERIGKELGVEVESLETLEDTLKKEVETRATRGLLDLLGGNR